MRDYAKISPLFWTRGSGKKLRGKPNAQVVAFYLVTCPASNMIGIYYQPLVTIAHETGLSIDDTRIALGECALADFAHYDEDAEMVWVPNMASYQIGDELKPGDKRRGAVLAELGRVEGHRFADEFLIAYGTGYGIEGASKGHRRPFEGIVMEQEAPSKGLHDPREEQEQEQEQDPTGSASPVPVTDRQLLALESQEQAKRAKPESAELVSYFAQQWAALHSGDGRPPDLTKTDRMQASQLVKKHGLEACRGYVDRYLDDPDPWLADKGHPLAHLASRINGYRAKPPASKAPPRRDSEDLGEMAKRMGLE